MLFNQENMAKIRNN